MSKKNHMIEAGPWFCSLHASEMWRRVFNAAYLQIQVLTTLVYCSLKLDASDVGRIVVKEWLARKPPSFDGRKTLREEQRK